MKQKVILIFFASKFKMRFSLPYLRCTNHHFWFFSSEMKSFNLSRPKQNHQVHSEFGWIFLILRVQFLHTSDCFVLSSDDTEKSASLLNINGAHVLMQMAECCTVMWPRWKIPRGKVTVQYLNDPWFKSSFLGDEICCRCSNPSL